MPIKTPTSCVFWKRLTLAFDSRRVQQAASVSRMAPSSSDRFFAAGIGAGIAEALTLPIDIAKVRLQTQARVYVQERAYFTGRVCIT